MSTVNPADVEAEDVKKVDRALQALVAGNVSEAQTLLTAVIENTPAGYVNSSQAPDGTPIVKCWGQEEFVHYVMWQNDHGIDRSVQWTGNAYPRAYYHLGFICVKLLQFERALEYLEKGHELDPDNPHFIFEKAQAMTYTGKKDEALALYQSVRETGPYVSKRNLACARRGSGFLLIEMGRLDEAEEDFQASLVLEPDNLLARNELEYIDRLRKGGRVCPAGALAVGSADLSRCVICGNRFTKGVIINDNGTPVSICKDCQRKLTKKWWQFWK
jgi:tetratricopeptide (TPR) repeat protein